MPARLGLVPPDLRLIDRHHAVPLANRRSSRVERVLGDQTAGAKVTVPLQLNLLEGERVLIPGELRLRPRKVRPRLRELLPVRRRIDCRDDLSLCTHFRGSDSLHRTGCDYPSNDGPLADPRGLHLHVGCKTKCPRGHPEQDDPAAHDAQRSCPSQTSSSSAAHEGSS